MMMRLGYVAAAFAVAMAASAHSAEPAAVTGRWATEDRNAIVLIGPCGRALCGTIERFVTAQPQGNDQRDVNNPDPAKRKRRLLGTAILSGFVADGDVWRGQIYDPKSGKIYRSILRRKGAGMLEVKGCLGPFCQTQVWKKAG